MAGIEQSELITIGTGSNCSLENELRSAIERPRKVEDGFIPIDKFNKILTRQSVQRELQSCLSKLPTEKDLDAWVSAIWDVENESEVSMSRRKIFAVLILLNEPAKIKLFIDEDVRDKDLPIVRNADDEWECYSQGQPRVVEFLNDPNRWVWRDADSFYTYQWWMLSPIFEMVDGEVIFYELHPRIPLPFVKTNEHDEEDTLAGGYGDVWRASIHPAHYNLSNSIKDPTEEFAIKRLRSKDKRQFESEVESLKRFSNGNHPHLIKLLATYSHDRYHLIFPWAEGNLKDFWKRCSAPIRSYELALWIADQCRGIAEGLRMIHRDEFGCSLSPAEPKKGRHGDIKPENILLFKESGNENSSEFGTLKISDFGLTRWHRDISNHKKYEHGLAVSLTYRAPEHKLRREISQPWDIWTLGCLFLEFLTWYLHGWEKGVDEFSKQRAAESSSYIPEDNFYNLCSVATPSGYGASLKICVIDWINKLHASEGCSQFIHEFLDLISDDMLRIRDEKRHECKEIVDKLKNLFKYCEDKTYCFEDAHDQPRKRKTNDSDRSDPQDTAILSTSQVANTEEALSLVNADNNRGRRSSRDDDADLMENYTSTSNQTHHWDAQRSSMTKKPQPNNTLKQMTESPTALRADYPEFPSAVLAPTIPRKTSTSSESERAQDTPEGTLAKSSTDTSASTSNLAISERSRSPHRVAQRGESSYLQAGTLNDGTAGNDTDVEEVSRLSSSLPPNSYIQQPSSSNPKAEDGDTPNEGAGADSHPISKKTRFLEWLRVLICCV